MKDFFETHSGLKVFCKSTKISDEKQVTSIVNKLDSKYGLYLSSGVEFPDRYSQWDFGIFNPPLSIVGVKNQLNISSLNKRGKIILEILEPLFSKSDDVQKVSFTSNSLKLNVVSNNHLFSEEERSLQPSLFTPLRTVMSDFNNFTDQHLGFYGAFGFDLIYQFDQPKKNIERLDNSPVLHLYFPDRIFIFDRRRELATVYDYDFSNSKVSSVGIDRDIDQKSLLDSHKKNFSLGSNNSINVDIEDSKFAFMVDEAREFMRKGDIFEVVLSRSFSAEYKDKPSSLFERMRKINPSPYEFFFQFGEEQLIGASPEMFVRVEGNRVESSPISGTVRRGNNPMEDAQNIKILLNSEKDEVELTMCTDVDRNDKSRICKPGTIKLLERRMIERYAGLFHTVDHVEGVLRDGFTGLDAFLSHMWAVTLTGAPKQAAVATIENLEKEPRGWYGGAVGVICLNGNVNTGITIRTVSLNKNTAIYRAGATLVWDSVGIDEAAETRTKANAFFSILNSNENKKNFIKIKNKISCNILLIDNEDSFSHTLGDYFRQAGASVKTFRHGIPLSLILEHKPDLVVHSPGPRQPKDFGIPELVLSLANSKIPQFGVCLGLQGIAEAFGGSLKILDVPRHGKQWAIQHTSEGIFKNIESPCRFGAYHSLVVDKLPEELEVTAWTKEGLVMALRHKKLPIQALQFHPESILSMNKDIGHRLIHNVLESFCTR